GRAPLTPNLGHDVHLCRRTRLAGHRVAVVPTAEDQHASATEQDPVADAWAAARWLRLKHTGFFGLVGGWLWGVLATLGVLIAGVFVKDPATGLAQARGIVRTLSRPFALLKSRKGARVTRTRSYDAITELRPSRSRVRDYRRSVLEISEPDRV